MLLLDVSTSAPVAPLPAGAPWWAWLALGLATLLVPAVVQVLLARRGGANAAKLVKDLAAEVAALKKRLDEGSGKADPAIAATREQRLHKLETDLARLDAEVREIKATMSRRADDDAQADRKLERELGRIAGLLEANNVGTARASRRA